MNAVTTLRRDAEVTILDVAANPALARELTPERRAALMYQHAIVGTALAQATLADVDRAGEDRAISVEAAADLLGLKVDTLYGKIKADPRFQALVIDMGTQAVRFSYRKVQRFISGSADTGSVAGRPARHG